MALGQRALWTLLVLYLVSTLTFLLIHLVPGDPVELLLGPQSTLEDQANYRAQLGLDRPLLEQYLNFYSRLFKGDLGQSLISRQPVLTSISEKLPATTELAVAALALATLLGIPLGILAAVRVRKLTDQLILIFGLAGVSFPLFWVGPLFIYLFSIKLGWLPVSERGGVEHLILPALTLGLALSAILIRMTRASFLECLNEDYVRTAYAKGLSPRQVHFKHVLKNAMNPVITILGLQFGSLLTGAVVTETIFDWPGIGTLLFQSIQRRDYPMVQGCVLFIAFVFVLVNFFTDLIYRWLDPRVST